MSDRLIGIIIALMALAFFASATQLETPFFSDPVGPKLFPYIISTIAFLASFKMIITPDKNPVWPKISTFISLIVAIIVLVFYAYSLRPLGFLVPTAICASLLSYQIKPNIKLQGNTVYFEPELECCADHLESVPVTQGGFLHS